MDANDFIQSRLTDDFLEHHGVKGMKWGKRKKPDFSDGSHLKNIDQEKTRYKALQNQYKLADIDWSKSFTTYPKQVSNSLAARKQNEANRNAFEGPRYKSPLKRKLSDVKLSDLSKLRPLAEGIQSGYQIARYLG